MKYYPKPQQYAYTDTKTNEMQNVSVEAVVLVHLGNKVGSPDIDKIPCRKRN